MTFGLRLLATLCVLGFALMISASPPAAAHTRLVATEPEAGAEITDTLEAVVLHFSEPVNQAIAEVEILAPDGTVVEEGAVLIDGARVARAVGVLPAAGEYVVSFRVIASDGHALTGEFRFTYDGPVEAVEPEPVLEPSPEPSGTPDAPATEEAADPRAAHTPTARDSDAGAATTGRDGGEDHDLLATAAPADQPVPWRLLGVAIAVLLAFVVATGHALRALLHAQPQS